ncbi:cadherin-related family member 5 [Bombina bombina]|uniref:cadherin-related family member 5 n=1 Tax=Bombina bombina TaxID=8345 RepID=UPI00235A9080|nr:cadherin-related family member 5 [Bombina bombina]
MTISLLLARLGLCKEKEQVEYQPIIITIMNLNDNSPVFSQTVFSFTIPEDERVNTTLGAAIEAKDADNEVLIYELTGPDLNAVDYFRLASQSNPTILVNKRLDYDVYQHIQLILTVRDTQTAGAPGSHTATATINITIKDSDDKPPQFLPCTDYGNKVCISDGYRGEINRTEQVTGPLHLTPGPLYAVDGDVGINAMIMYRIIGGNVDNIFAVDASNGNITMTKAADNLGTIILQVMAYQNNDNTKYALTTVQIHVKERNEHPPIFTSNFYEGDSFVNAPVDAFINEFGSSGKPLRVFAKDDDFDDTVNPAVTYRIQNSSDFRISREGYIFTNAVINSPTTIVFAVSATDTSTGEVATTLVNVNITPGLSTTPGTGTTKSTTPGTGTTITSTSGTGTTTRTTPGTGTTTTNTPGTGTTTRTTPGTGTTTPTTPGTGTTTRTTPGTGTTTPTTPGTGTTTRTTPGTGTTTTTTPGTGTTTSKIPGTGTTANTTPGTGTTTRTTPGTGTTTSTTPGTGTTRSTTPGTGTTANITPGTGTTKSTTPGTGTTQTNTPGTGTTISVGGPQSNKIYTTGDMAALGASLGAVLAVCLAGLGFLIYKLHGDSIRRRLGKSLKNDSGGSNDRLQHLIDDELGEDRSQGPNTDSPNNGNYDTINPINEEPLGSPSSSSGAAVASLQSTDPPRSEAPGDALDPDDKKEVKSILTKEFKGDAGYKSVWFMENSEPEVVLIEGAEEGEVDDFEDNGYNNREDDDDEDEDDIGVNPNFTML